MQFLKLHGYGNDYIVFEGADLEHVTSLGDFARRVCDRHYGAGSDGIAVAPPLTEADADFEVRIFNPDGSEASLSGNGTRCAAAYLHYQGLWSSEEVRLRTRSGVKLYRLVERRGQRRFVFDSELGRPAFESDSVPIQTDEPMTQVADYPLSVQEQTVRVTAIRMGNPNCCVFVEDFDALDWKGIGRALETHRLFPERTNVVFARVLDREALDLRFWERGVGVTLASGTCACAAAVASALTGRTGRDVAVHMPGGQIRVAWRDDGEVVLTGEAEVVYRGEWLAGYGLRAVG